ncbi:sigma-70 family RNA polymerase sigma factor [Micromonospora echinofusca]|uniref:sigma-70 family RNA polymerase sigma factor n=1 Tax=Micromonospora echinofusca TaxID=47858 RepID=UPI003F4DFA46
MTAELTRSRGHHPSAAELADHLEVRVEEVQATALAAQTYRLMSLDAPRHDTDDLGTLALIGAVDPAFARVDDHLVLRSLLADLPAGASDPDAALPRPTDPEADRRAMRAVADARVTAAEAGPRPAPCRHAALTVPGPRRVAGPNAPTVSNAPNRHPLPLRGPHDENKVGFQPRGVVRHEAST